MPLSLNISLLEETFPESCSERTFKVIQITGFAYHCYKKIFREKT